MDIWLTKTYNSLSALTSETQEQLSKLKVGQDYKVKVTKPRNVKFHRKFFALVKFTFVNLPEKWAKHIKSQEVLLQEIKLATGHVDVFVSVSGERYYVPKSINFAKMDDIAFEEFYKSALDFVCGALMKEVPQEVIEQELINFM